MNKKNRRPLFFVLSWLLVILALWAGVALAQMPRNVVLMIGDGLGYNSVQAAAYFRGTPPVYAAFPVGCGVSTYAHGGSYDPRLAWENFDYVRAGATDSAAAATAMVSGVKTCNGVLGVAPRRDGLTTIVEIAAQAGKAAGVVTDVPFSHATPAALAVRQENRNNYESIAREMLASRLQVIMGTGHPEFDNNGRRVTPTPARHKYVGGPATWRALKQGVGGWRLLETKEDFADLAESGRPPGVKVLGVPQVYHTLQQKRAGDGQAPAPQEPRNDRVPSLAVMALGALQVLNQNPQGFFLMVEGGAIDWACHEQQLGRLIEAQMDFDAAVAAVAAWVEANGGWNQTLLIVTSDHETGHLWGPGSGPPASFKPLLDKGPGQLPGAKFFSTEHTNALVPLYAKGDGAHLVPGYADKIDPKRGPYLDNTAIFRVMSGQRAVSSQGSGVGDEMKGRY
jgi:alkaline phosphatase